MRAARADASHADDIAGISHPRSAPTTAVDAAVTPGLLTGVVFDEYSPLASSTELERRLLSPLQAQRVNQALAKSGRALSEQSIDLAKETFTVYVPAAKPAQGYALLVFILPWNAANLPARWPLELDRHGMIFVTPARAGNGEKLLDRREPLALLAAHNIMRRYSIDPARVYVGGFSGGSRVALRLALAYPDLFHGALLNAGSGPIGNAEVRLPPAALMHKFQEASRLVFLTGQDDWNQRPRDERGRKSMLGWCVFNYASVTVGWFGHEVLPASAFNQGLDALEVRDAQPPEKITLCRAQYEQELDDQMRQVETLRSGGRIDAAIRMLDAIDLRFGGLAAPGSVDLARQVGR
jgi:dienelactone hydrolase